ncbi:MAG TPA: YggT family protein [Ktedonobacterales bacterium]
MEPTEPVQPVEPVYREERYEPVRPVEPVEPVVPVAPVEPRYRPPISPAYRLAQVVYLILGIVETLLAIRFVMKLLAANADAAFTALIYGITGPLVAPFEGVFPNAAGDRSVLELATLLAMVIYALLAWGIVKVIDISRRRQPPVTAA